MTDEIYRLQAELCGRFGTELVPSFRWTKFGLAKGFDPQCPPLNGLRHLPEEGTSGWFVWNGVYLPTDADFFEPHHVAHLDLICPSILQYLGLAPGWRFLVAPGYEDVWFDQSLLSICK